MIVVRELTKSFGPHVVLDGLDFTVERGAVTLLVGANGAGKTTALRILAGLAEPDGGSVAIAGHDLRVRRASALAQLAFLPQAPRFHARLTVTQVARFYARLRGRETQAVAAALDEWGLADCARVPTGKLSGGLRQRLALAVFALADAPVLLLDEPGLSLDPGWRLRLHGHLTAAARRGRTVLVATHLLGEWENRTDRCLLVADGRCAGELPPDRLREAFFEPEEFSAPVPAAWA